VKALALLSGGLDGLLAARVVADQGVAVCGVHFVTAFLRAARTEAARRSPDLDVGVMDVSREHFESVVVRPKYGYGAAMNPCIDCRIFMLRKAASYARERSLDLVVTGEVLGQSRMSQRRESLARIERESGLAGRLLRPLSAAHLSPTEAEKEGRIVRSRLGSIEGRSRTAQLALARAFGMPVSLSPGGGCCLLADLGFSRRLRDLLAHGGPTYPGPDAMERLRLGRHFRLSHGMKAVVARDDEESRGLGGLAEGLWSCRAEGGGALVVVEGEQGEAGLARAAALAARYGAGRDLPRCAVVCRRGTEERRLEVSPEAEAGRFLV
jgi:tRNA-uridine 2-sulfurtransferase